MTRVDNVRAARTSPHVIFSEYIKLRAKWKGLIVIFEGKHCPGVYVAWMSSAFPDRDFQQIITRGKRYSLELRDLIKKNLETNADLNLYFVDRDFDRTPGPGDCDDVYVTRGYAIENEMLEPRVLGRYLRAYFDVNSPVDNDIVDCACQIYSSMFDLYIAKSKDLQRVIYVCHQAVINCYPGEDVGLFFDIDWSKASVKERCQTLEQWLDVLKVALPDKVNVLARVGIEESFEEFDPTSRWRGKLHFDFLKKYLVHLADARRRGSPPFNEAAKIVSDPSHPSLMVQLAGFTQPPECFVTFVRKYLEMHSPPTPA